VTKVVAPSLDELAESLNPAWLWDGERARIVWANKAGADWFGAETLFDLLELVFDRTETGVAKIIKTAEQLRRGKSVEVDLAFSAAIVDEPLECTCYVHALVDGRAGLLVTADTSQTGSQRHQLSPAIQTLALGAFPLPICVIEGRQRLLFANSAMKDVAGNSFDYGFAADLIDQSHKAGLVSKLLKLPTLLGIREMQVIVRPLEKAKRLADASFLVVLEDVTDRRAVERSLVDGNVFAIPKADEPLSKADEPLPKADEPLPKTDDTESQDTSETDNPVPETFGKDKPITGDVAQTLSHLRSEIENQTRGSAETGREPARKEPPATPEKPLTPRERKKKAKEDALVVPDIVSSTLNNLPQPLVLINNEGVLLFANDVAVSLLEAESWQQLGKMTTLADALHALEGEDGFISLFTVKDEPLNLDALISTFPWKDGPVIQATLTPVDDGEKADNRRTPEQQARLKKKDEITTEKVTQVQPLAAVRDNVTTLPVGQSDGGPSDHELRAILDTATDGIVTLTNKGDICSFSAGAEALFGYKSSEVIGRSFMDLLGEKSREVISDYLAALNGSGLAAVFNDGREVEAVVKQGGEISLFLTIGKLETAQSKPGFERDGNASFCVVVRDITQWKKNEADLRQSKEEAEKSNAQKSLFLANISHELRTPLNAIMGFSEVMRSQRFGDIENEKYLGYANDIHASGEYLLSLINDLLDLSKIDAGKLELNFTSVNLLNIIDDAINSLQDQATNNRILMRKAAAGNLPNVVADLRSMKQVLLNLLSNSVKFTKPGGQIIISAKLEEDGKLCLTIKDTGRGMNKAELKRALQPFQQVEGPKDGEMPGTGLGLPLTKALVEANRAEFKITSKRKKGTRVDIIFPTTRVLAE
jgi:PAS domain S-box-containing protein